MTTPVLHQTPYGWLAVSPPGERLRFAVTAQTEADAVAKYAGSLERWRTAAALAALDSSATEVTA